MKDNFFVHPSAIIEKNVIIGSKTRIWCFSHLMDEAQIGENCNIGQNVFIGKGVIIGNNVKIQNNVSVYEGVTCEDDVFLGPSMVFTNVKKPRSSFPRNGIYDKTLVQKGATIGANATIVCGINIGQYAFVGAGSVVTKNVLPFSIMVGNPAKRIGWISKRGERLIFNSIADNIMKANCPIDNSEYVIEDNKVYCK